MRHGNPVPGQSRRIEQQLSMCRGRFHDSLSLFRHIDDFTSPTHHSFTFIKRERALAHSGLISRNERCRRGEQTTTYVGAARIPASLGYTCISGISDVA